MADEAVVVAVIAAVGQVEVVEVIPACTRGGSLRRGGLGCGRGCRAARAIVRSRLGARSVGAHARISSVSIRGMLRAAACWAAPAAFWPGCWDAKRLPCVAAVPAALAARPSEAAPAACSRPRLASAINSIVSCGAADARPKPCADEQAPTLRMHRSPRSCSPANPNPHPHRGAYRQTCEISCFTCMFACLMSLPV